MVDISHLKLEDEAGKYISLKKSGNWLTGACPFCGQGKDRFYINTAKQTFKCRKCLKSGNIISFVMYRQGVDFLEACRVLGVQLPDRPQKPRATRQLRQPTTNDINAVGTESQKPALNDPAWREGAMSFVDACWRALWHSHSHKLEYLHGRGFTDATLDVHMIGYNHVGRAMMWGEHRVWMPQGWVIPHFDHSDTGDVMCVRVRTEKNDLGGKYIQATGGANWLYLSSRIKPDSTVVLVEGELDALTIRQAYPHHLVAPVATCSVAGARLLKWVGLLATARRVLVAYDHDEAGAGAATYWRRLLANAYPARAHRWKDVNEMYASIALADDQLEDYGNGYAAADAAVKRWIGGVS